MRLQRTVVAVAAALLVAPFLAAGAGGAAPGPGKEDPRADAAARRVSDYATARGALGVFHDPGSSAPVIRVPATGPGSDLSRADLSSAGVAAQVRPSRYTRAQIDTAAAVLRQRAWHPAAMRYSYGFHYDAERDLTVVGTDAPADVMAPVLNSLPTQVSYEPGPTRRLSRQNDPVPHWGGASITDGTGVCSSGFVVKNAAGTRFMVTAGHCFASGTAVRSSGGGGSFGTVVNRGPFPSFDMELLGGSSYGSSIYVGDATGAGVSVAGAANPAVGFSGYCRSGQTTFQQCGKTVTSLTGSFCDAAGCTTSLITYTGGLLAAGGDSGSPFYLPGPSVFIMGMEMAISGGTEYAEAWNTIANHFGVSIVTS